MCKESIRNIVVMFQTSILIFIRFYVRHSASGMIIPLRTPLPKWGVQIPLGSVNDLIIAIHFTMHTEIYFLLACVLAI